MVSSGNVIIVAGAVGSITMTDPMRYLTEARRLDAVLLDHMGVKGAQHPALGASVVFPYRRGGEPYAGKWRAVETKDFRSTRDVSRGLYNEDALKQDGPIVITEGEIDCLSVIQAGWMRALSLPDGWTEDAGKRDALVSEEARLRQSPFVIVAGDADAVGASLPKAVANILAGHDVRYARWPDGCKDANDVLVKYGEAEVSRCLVEAKRIDPPGGFITGISDLPPLPARRVLRMGMAPYDFALAFEVGAMSVGTGTPGSGKSTFTTFAAYHVAKHEKVRVGMLAFETHPHRIRDHLAKLHCRTGWDYLDPTQRARFGEFADNHFRIVHREFDGNDPHHLGWLQSMVYTLAVRDGCKLIIVDPWNELEHLPEAGESMTAYINFALQQIRQWAEQYDTHICVIAHPRKMPTEGKPRAPSGYDIADSAAFFNKPSLGFSVARQEGDEGAHWVRVETWKVRDAELYGFTTGNMRLTFLHDNMTYIEYRDQQGGNNDHKI